jgi:DNA processing protein
MSDRELALAAFAAARDAHHVVEPRGRGFERFVRSFDAVRYRSELTRRGLQWVGRTSPGYPLLLARIHDPPAGLFLRGQGSLELLSQPAVAVVGARGCSGYGSRVARTFGRELAAAGVVVVSGLARGIDAEAHRGALEANGLTVGVLGCGIDRDYPAAHRELAARIAERSLVVSEYAPGVQPAPWRFPARNRIVAGLTLAMIVVEARERSGALITADLALEEGRDVFAVPGEITSRLSDGSNALLRLGAIPVLRPADVLEHLGIEPPDSVPVELGAAAGQVLAAIRAGAVTADEVARSTSLAAAVVSAALVELELAGAVGEDDGTLREVMPAH